MTDTSPAPLPTSERLARALEAEYQKTPKPRLLQLARLAREGRYDDFKSPLPFPLVSLVGELQRLGLDDLAGRVKGGEFDATAEESQAWFEVEGKAMLAGKDMETFLREHGFGSLMDELSELKDKSEAEVEAYLRKKGLKL